MKQLIYDLDKAAENKGRLCLATVLFTRGSTPQVSGASALFSSSGLLHGTLGGGVMEGDATERAREGLDKGLSRVYSFELNASIEDSTGAICGGSALILLDSDPGGSAEVFRRARKDLEEGHGGILITRMLGRAEVRVERCWVPEGTALPEDWDLPQELAEKAGASGETIYREQGPEIKILLQPIQPREELIIAGAGHIGKALSHLGRLLDFRVRVIDSRPEYAHRSHLPDAHEVEALDPGAALAALSLNQSSYVVIVTRGHQEDASALKACIGSEAAYVGMIGSRRKIRTMREEFIRQGWATDREFDRIHAPVGMKIGAETVQEIALSIAAELVQVRRRKEAPKQVAGIVLAAGSSSRMGKPKMLLPFGEVSILENVLRASRKSSLSSTTVVLGNHEEKVSPLLDGESAVVNPDPGRGMLSSIQCGVQSLPEKVDGMLLLLGDQPRVDTRTINRLLRAFQTSTRKIFIASFQGKKGHPVLISRTLFNEILELPPEQSLRELMGRYPGEIEEVDCDNPGILVDIDTPQEYANELKKIQKQV